MPDEDAAQLSIKSGGEPSATERAIALLERAPPPPPRAGSAAGRLARLQRALDEMTRRRDEQACEVRRLRHELDKAKGRHDRYAELKEAHAALQEDYSSLQASLEASERIRAKQRDLLRSLQGDESVADDDASPLEDDRYERLMTGEESFIGDDADESPSPPPPPRRAVKKVGRRKASPARKPSPARKASPATRRGVSPVARKTRKVATKRSAGARPAAAGRRAAATAPSAGAPPRRRPPGRRVGQRRTGDRDLRATVAAKTTTKKARRRPRRAPRGDLPGHRDTATGALTRCRVWGRSARCSGGRAARDRTEAARRSTACTLRSPRALEAEVTNCM